MEDVEPAPAPAPDPEAHEAVPRGRWRFVSLVPNDGQEPPFDLSDEASQQIWAAISAPWHPALLVEAADLPSIEDVDFPSHPDRDEVRVIAAGAGDRLPSGYRTQAADIGALVVEGTSNRFELVRQIAERVARLEPAEEDPVALDFLALGTARWWLRDLTTGMGHADVLDVESLRREVLAGARAWRDRDLQAATNRLRAAFEVLTQARERIYPVDAYFLDLCLLDPNSPAGALADALEARTPVTILAPARAIAMQAERDPQRLAELRAAINEGWADVVGGPYGEADEPLRPVESILWQLRKGYETYREHLDDRAVETFGRRRFGLYPQLPQILRRFGFRFAYYLGLDAGQFPVPVESKRLWEAPDGSQLEALTRLPLAGDRSAEGSRLAWRLARSMKDDHVAVIPIVHWPGVMADWFRDLRRIARYSPVLARLATCNDFFHLTDRPWDTFRPGLDEFVTPYLAQAIARRDTTPLSRRVIHATLRARLDALAALRSMARCLLPTSTSGLSDSPPDAAFPEALAHDTEEAENAAESGRFAESRALLDRLEPIWAGRVAAGVLGARTATENARPGYLILNPLGVARRCPVRLADAAADLRPEGPLRTAQFTDEGVVAVVDLPAHGFAWVPREASLSVPPPTPGILGVKARTLRNELIEVEIDERTGGIRGLRAAGEPFVRVGQQLVLVGLEQPSRMTAERFEVDYGGPALVQAWSEGTLNRADGRSLARFVQRYRLWSGRPIVELDLRLFDLDAAWLDAIANADPWQQYLACRWAWPDPEADLRRTSLLAPEITRAERPETPDALDLSTRRERTALLFGGLAHHRRHGARMLDTLLLAGRESAREYRLGIAVDQEYPFQAVMDLLTPAVVVPTEFGPPASGPVGWIFQLDNRGVAMTRLEPQERSSEGRGWGIVFHLLETTGRASRCRLRLPWRPSWARQTDFTGEPIMDLTIDGDAVAIDLTPHELACIEVTLG